MNGWEPQYTKALFKNVKNGPSEESTIEMIRSKMLEDNFDPEEAEVGISVLISKSKLLHLGRRFITTLESKKRLPTYKAERLKRYLISKEGRASSYGELKKEIDIGDDEKLRGELVFLFNQGCIYLEGDKIYFDEF
ncbi:hypothetical protein AVEN_99009-1 [Araneus ventricosus]|uniref:Uncharacterized protein n=1 Tax=Araneus ventricosus TaxID=182803 RepID=A0A4Y2G5C2_ARAVE|nr:hypothetical protein AVEN_99009-1 [Araneus ventricosus]